MVDMVVVSTLVCSPDERGGSVEVERVVERVVSQAELDRADPTLTEQMRRLQLSHSTGHTSTPSLALCVLESYTAKTYH